MMQFMAYGKRALFDGGVRKRNSLSLPEKVGGNRYITVTVIVNSITVNVTVCYVTGESR